MPAVSHHTAEASESLVEQSDHSKRPVPLFSPDRTGRKHLINAEPENETKARDARRIPGDLLHGIARVELAPS